MGTSLTGQTKGSTYDSLLKITDNGPVGGSLKVVTDGLGNDSALQISSAGVASSGTLAVTGVSTLAGVSATTVAASGAVTAATTLAVAGAATVGGTLGVTGATTLAAASCTTLAASGAATLSSTLAVTSNATVGGTLGVTGATTLAALSATTINGSAAAVLSSLTLATPLAVAQGGTGATTQGAAQTALGIGTAGLQSYATGSWTPSIGGTATYLQQNGSYLKIGNLVFIWGGIQINNRGTGSQTNISGLPFAPSLAAQPIQIGYFETSSTSFAYLAGLTNGSTIDLWGSVGGAVVTMTQSAYFTNLSKIYFSGCYLA